MILQDFLSFEKSTYNFTTAKKILYYTPKYSIKDWNIGEGNSPFELQVCRIQNCYLTSDKDLLGKGQIDKFDALLFHVVRRRESNQNTGNA